MNILDSYRNIVDNLCVFIISISAGKYHLKSRAKRNDKNAMAIVNLQELLLRRSSTVFLSVD